MPLFAIFWVFTWSQVFYMVVWWYTIIPNGNFHITVSLIWWYTHFLESTAVSTENLFYQKGYAFSALHHFGGMLTLKSGLGFFVWAPQMPFFGTWKRVLLVERKILKITQSETMTVWNFETPVAADWVIFGIYHSSGI